MKKGAWPSWDTIYQYWLEIDVPDVEVIKFDYDKHVHDWPWLDKEKDTQIYTSNPINTTAYHLASYLRGKEKELISAYKIYASIKHHGAEYMIMEDALNTVFKKYDNLSSWWTANSKIVLPSSSISAYKLPRYHDEPSKWKEVVSMIAQEWTAIAKERAVIYIPDYMDGDSTEYQDYLERSNKDFEERQYQEYLRLKDKFENSNTN